MNFKKQFKKIIVLGCVAFLFNTSNAQNTVTITDASLTGNNNFNWTKNNIYLLDGLVYLEAGGVLNIEEGTVIKFKNTNPASALIITRGAQIFAEGTIDEPIIFTAEADDVSDPLDLGPDDVGLWGGLILLGRATTFKNGNSEVNIEGIPTTEVRGLYGDPNGNFNDDDNSGVLKYVSIRHTGFGLTTGSELQGLTLAGVGRGTTIDFVESYASSDDGVEIFGGTVDLKHFVAAFIEDDTYDFDETWTGKGQFWFGIQRVSSGGPDAGFEADGSTPDNVAPVSNPTIYNVTMIGSGVGATRGGRGWLLRAGIQGTYANSVLTDFRGKCLEVQDRPNNSTTDAYAQLVAGNINLLSNAFWHCGAASSQPIDASSNGIIQATITDTCSSSPNSPCNANGEGGVQVTFLINHLTSNNNFVGNPEIVSIEREQNESLDPRPSLTGAAYSGTLASLPSNDSFFSPTDYRGAFSANPADFWIAKWTALYQNNHLNKNIVTGIKNIVVDNNISIFPNPTNRQFKVDFNGSAYSKYDIINMNGQVISSSAIPLNTFAFEINTQNFSNGLYLIRLINEKGLSVIKRISIQK